MKISTQNGVVFQQKDGQTILDASIEAGYPINHSCRAGRCGFCKVKLLTGQSESYRCQQLSQQEIDENWILTCCHTALTDVHIDAGQLQQVSVPKVCSIPCAIDSLEWLTPDVLEVTLQLPLIVKFSYLAGQYVDLSQAGGVSSRYCVTELNGNTQPQKIALHVLANNQDPMDLYWFKQAKVADLLSLEGPKGAFFLRNVSQRDVFFVIYGRNVSPVLSMLATLEALPKAMQAASVTVIWQGQAAEDFYLDLTSTYGGFEVIQTLPPGCANLSEKVTETLDIILNMRPELSNVVVYATGPALLLERLQLTLLQNKLNPQDYYSQGSFDTSGMGVNRAC
ncbi:2Fe-2S iron-sulfur cluster-binding protein [Aliiglaciecola sp. 3_MG-2023]|uniref:2Fe-2S iron-sulfur cluster-binding protein n=1 Tax=Aliiglaciecola sp. 3_MG-2023 TaxID=3062644 RepID=UPI0026E256FF|nr:2Fe-2S iron-sulfur cluster-binding protein [Aliiglaciecola sp. 3_MG-2023]MDO6693070.1 2Fe-2S iron-sulfur cluster-binding protein [Aliiglaciecola sp. 3_MG-2023]